MQDLDLPEYAVVEQLDHPLASALCGMTRPDRFTAFLVDGLSVDMEDGGFDPKNFSAGGPQGLFAALSEDEGNRAYSALSAYLKGRRASKDLAGDDCEAVVAAWKLSDGRIGLLVLDANRGGQQPMQETWEEVSRIMHFGAYEADRVVAQDRFDPARVLAEGRAPARLLQDLADVSQPAAPAPVRARRSP